MKFYKYLLDVGIFKINSNIFHLSFIFRFFIVNLFEFIFVFYRYV